MDTQKLLKEAEKASKTIALSFGGRGLIPVSQQDTERLEKLFSVLFPGDSCLIEKGREAGFPLSQETFFTVGVLANLNGFSFVIGGDK